VITIVEGITLNLANTLFPLLGSTYDCVIVAGGNVASVIENEEVDAFLLENYRNPQTVIGGICNGAWVMAKAGLLKGKTVTHTAHSSCDAPTEVINTAAPYFAGSEYSFENVVIDGRIVTAKPWAKAEFTVRVAELAGVVEENKADYYLRLLRGDYKTKVEGRER
jgi:putative intracellular protease/amidase